METKSRVLRVFFDNPAKKFHIREIARITKLNPNTVLNILRTLEKGTLIKKTKMKHIVEVSANINEEFKNEKRINNLSRLYESGIIEFLVNEFHPEAISVVGSYSTGEDIENSDIDLVIISKIEKELNLSKFERFFNRKIHLIITGYKSMSEEFYLNLINGIILDGYLDKK
jgi:predicted nucleotidyltransferase